MGLIKSKEKLPGWQTAKALYDKLPGSGTVKKVIVGATAAVLLVGALAAGAIGIAAMLTWVAGSVLGSVLLAAGIIALLPAVISFIGTAVPILYNFNWNVSDAQIESELKAALVNLYGQLGESAGVAVGWLVCGIAPGLLTFMCNPAAAILITQNMTTEAAEEVWDSLAAAKQASISLLASSMVKQGYKNARRWLKNPKSPFYGFLKEHFGQNFEKWGNENQPAFSFATAVEEKIESIKDPGVRQATEEFVENLFSSCSAAFQQLSQEMRNHLTASALFGVGRTQAQSSQMVVQVNFNPASDPPPASSPATP
jgi:hypothetical protein